MRIDEEILKDLTIEDMPNGDLRLVAEFCGLEVAVKLLQELPGIQINIPKNGFKKVIEKYICEHYDGTNAKELALRLGVTERYVYQVCQRGNGDKGQAELFEIKD